MTEPEDMQIVPGEVGLALYVASPWYVAVRVRGPTVVSAIWQLPAATVPVQLFTPSVTSTVPVGVATAGGTGVTV